MQIQGFQKTTLLDYPGKIAATIFLSGCNFRCPFCHNKTLVVSPDSCPSIPFGEILSFLKKRSNIIEGICITGGEPTLSPFLKEIIIELKKLDLQVKLDTNGTSPAILSELINEHLINYVAMDIKGPLEKYSQITDIPKDYSKEILSSIKLLISSSIDYEFRTTVVKELHVTDDFIKIGDLINGADSYYLQAYLDSPDVIMPGFSSYSFEELSGFKSILEHMVSKVNIRGI